MTLLKHVFLIAIIAVAMIGVMVPSVFAATYVNDDYPYEFSINYPTDWLIFEPDENEKKNNPGIMVYLNNNYDATSIVTIYYYEFEDWDTYSTNELIDSNLLRNKQHCESQSLSTTGIECTNYKNYEELTKVLKINGYPSITIVSYVENRYQMFGESHSLIETITDIYIENAIYQIVSVTDQNLFLDSGYDDVYQIVNSFTVGKSYVNSDLPTSFEEATEVMIAFKNSVKEYEQEKPTTETKTNLDKIYAYDEIYAAADQAGLDCDNKHGPPFYSMDQQYAYNNCHNSINTWELNQLDRTDYYGEPQRESSGGGCLIATATYGSEMSTEVQQLRELRDNQLLQTESGTAFMTMFNDVYYSFSPVIADYERENPYFKEAVKIAITPMISSLSLMENANSESEVVSLGLSVIALNLGMYLGVPAVLIVGIRKRI